MKLYKFLLACLVFGVMIFGSFGVVSATVSQEDFGWLEIVDYEPDESITLKFVIQNTLDKDIHIIEPVAVPTPWGTDLIYGNISSKTIYPTVIPNASEGDALTGGLGPLMRVEFDIDKYLEPGEKTEMLLELKINDWKGHSPSGMTKFTFPYQLWMQTEEDTFFDYPTAIVKDITEAVPRAKPGTFAFLEKFRALDLTPDIINNKYGIFPDIKVMEPGKSQDITITIWDGNKTEVKNAIVNLNGCGVSDSTSTYPYEFEGVNPTSRGKIRVNATWEENDVTMHAVDFISVSPSPNNKASFDIHNVAPTFTQEGDQKNINININAKVTDPEGVDMALIEYQEDNRPWRVYISMEEGDNNMYSTNINYPWWHINYYVDVIKYRVVCIDETGDRTESDVNQYTVTPYGVTLNADTTEKTTKPNVNAEYAIKLENIGEKEDTYDLSVSNPDNADVAKLNKQSVSLPAGESETITLNVADEIVDTYRINVTATSNNDPDKSYYISTTTTVGSPSNVMTKQQFINKIKEVGDDKAIDLTEIESCEKYNQWCKAINHIKWDEQIDNEAGKAVFIDDYKTDNPPTDIDQIRFYDSKDHQVDELDETWLTERVNELSFKKEPTIKLSLSKGWNIISSPVEESLTISDIEEFCSLKTYKGHKMWAFNTEEWTNPEQVESNEGVYVYANSDCTIELEGEKSEFGEKELKSGWNLISAGNNSLNDVIGDCKIKGDIWKLDKGDWVYPELDEVLNPGKGYWVEVEEDCTLGSEISSPPLPGPLGDFVDWVGGLFS